MGLLADLGLWLWRLLPGNPILVRVVATGGKRTRHLWVRGGYLIALVLVFLLFGGLLIGHTNTSLAELAKKSTKTFMAVSIVQLVLMSFIAPVFCAAAITQEKDSNTFHILLTTPLTNGQIVLGALFSRLYFVWVLLLSGLPIFCITMLYGGVTTAEVFESFGLAACTGLVTGSIAILISFLKVGTRRTIFSFFLGIAVYLLGGALLGLSPWGQFTSAPLGPQFGITGVQYHMSWLSCIHPFLALLVVIGLTPAPDPADLVRYGWPARWLLAYPPYAYMWLSVLASAVMILLSLIFVRRGAREGEDTLLNRLLAIVQRQTGERRREPRRVWSNPIAWREAKTRGSAGGRSILRPLFSAGGIAAGVLLLLAHHFQWYGLNSAAAGGLGIETTRAALTALIWLEFAVILLIVTSTAASTLTREKETQTMEILLTTPLTSKYILGGMLQGLVRLVLPLIAVPAITLLLFSAMDLFTPGSAAVTTFEAVVLAPALMTAFAALAAMIGLQFSLTSKKTVQAVMAATATVLFVTGLLSLCGISMSAAGAAAQAVLIPFTAFPALQLLVDPWQAAIDINAPGGRISDSALLQLRVTRAVLTLFAIGALAGVTAILYNGLVRGFDVTVRRQSA